MKKLFQIEDASASASVIVPSNSKKPFWTTAIASSPPCWILLQDWGLIRPCSLGHPKNERSPYKLHNDSSGNQGYAL
jgi:hypothetical protein